MKGMNNLLVDKNRSEIVKIRNSNLCFIFITAYIKMLCRPIIVSADAKHKSSYHQSSGKEGETWKIDQNNVISVRGFPVPLQNRRCSARAHTKPRWPRPQSKSHAGAESRGHWVHAARCTITALGGVFGCVQYTLEITWAALSRGRWLEVDTQPRTLQWNW